MNKKIIVALLLLGLSYFLAAQTEYEAYHYSVDFAQEGKAHHIYWNSTGFTPGDLLLRKDMQLTLDYLAAVPNQKTTYIRPHWLLNLIGSRGIGTNNPEFNFSQLDAALDEIISRGFKPIFEIMGFPSLAWKVGDNVYDDAAQGQKNQSVQWNPDFSKEDDYMQWYHFVKAMVSHLEKRYGEEELKTWFFESTNEPDIQPHFWDRSIAELLNYWDATREAIKAVNVGYKFGGPGTASGTSDEFKAILAHADTGINVITKQQGSIPDFISVHCKALPYQMIDMEMGVIEYIREKHPNFKEIPFWNNEADPTWGWSQGYWWRAHPWYASFVVQSIDAHNRLLIDSTKVNYGILLNDCGFMGDWYQRTSLARFTNPLDDDKFWLFKKPVLSVMTMLALGEGTRYDVHGYQSTRENVVVIPSRAHTGEIVVLLANKPYFGVVHDDRNQNEDIPLHQKNKHDKQGAVVNLSIKNPGFEKPEMMYLQLDALHGYAHGAWKNIGKPDTISSDIYRMVSANMDPVVVSQEIVIDCENINVVLPPSSVALLIIREKGKKMDFASPEIESIKEYSGFNGERKQFISWKQAKGAIVRYNVYASYNEGEYQRVNPYPLFERGYLNVLPDNVENVKYRIEVVNNEKLKRNP